MGKKPFIDRKQAKHYHVVHRSQRDPLIHDADASDRVLKEVIPPNMLKHKTQEEIDAVKYKPVQLNQDEIDRRVSQATAQGIYFDDVGDYDYTQHLKTIGDSTEAVFLEAPQREEKPKKSAAGGDLMFKEDQKERQVIELPADAMPSSIERNIGAMANVTGLEGGLQPDMDPRLREVLEALEDDEYADGQVDEDFFEELNAEGDPYIPEEEDFEEYEEEIEDGSYNWEAAFRNFQRGKQRRGSSDYSDDDDDLLERQTKRTGFSVSSSVMHRNAQLTLLDDRFEKIEEEYFKEDDDEDDEDNGLENLEDRADFDDILDDFLDKYEIVGRKMKPKLEGDTSGEKLDTLRQSLGAIRLSNEEDEDKPKSRKEDVDRVDIWERPVKQRETWDCQTVLSTYSNLENHPAMISDRGPKKKIVINPKTGMPSLVEKEPKKPRHQPIQEEQDDNEEEEDEDEEEIEPVNLGVARSKKESKDEKKARKAAVKEAKKNRRETKKSTKEAFKQEETRQRKTLQQQRKAKGVTHIA
ncbi:low temperature viability protein [Lichtheimia corymbifera JMRC:FSU:9682]|uniref:Low temperature viability protein n=1 Tax=Lichtheimia corymbifera JMRC:FSU:9682 TaxID=1263082 RepID=A0A068SB13_9FUNG|nr:low temperature viability protein [Lichtheimia corymbifera JMRC:FSU:9682]